MKKYTKEEVDFESPAKGMDNCRDCRHFLAHRRECDIVRGHIEPTDWCDKFSPISKLAHALRAKR